MSSEMPTYRNTKAETYGPSNTRMKAAAGATDHAVESLWDQQQLLSSAPLHQIFGFFVHIMEV